MDVWAISPPDAKAARLMPSAKCSPRFDDLVSLWSWRDCFPYRNVSSRGLYVARALAWAAFFSPTPIFGTP